jgi:hypothetical protein
MSEKLLLRPSALELCPFRWLNLMLRRGLAIMAVCLSERETPEVSLTAGLNCWIEGDSSYVLHSAVIWSTRRFRLCVCSKEGRGDQRHEQDLSKRRRGSWWIFGVVLAWLSQLADVSGSLLVI